MKRRLFFPSVALLVATTPLVLAQDASFKNEVNASMQKAIGFIKSKQLPSGAWGDPAVPGTQPALTALNLMSLLADPSREKNVLPDEAKQAVAYLFSVQKPDGGIYTEKPLATYNTALALTALSLTPLDAKGREAALKARNFLVGLQGKFDDKAQSDPNSTYDSPYNGGIGYTSKTAYSDLSNTHFALEALYYSKNLFADSPEKEKDAPQLDFAAAIKFVSRCQNLKATNDQTWASDDAKNKGGFVYRPGETKSETETLPDGGTALRSYASMSYAGLLSFVYADLSPKDQRIKAVMEWLGKNFSLTENPGMGLQGLFYYYHTMAKALAITKTDKLAAPDGKQINWRQDLAMELFKLQKADGSWANENPRWMEKDPILTTAYGVLTLAHLSQGL
jgi:squalene-hopene/tetraprenyl-beta-curcumene cyclase